MSRQTHAGRVRHNGRVTIAAKDLCNRCGKNRRVGRSPWCRACLAGNPVVVGRDAPERSYGPSPGSEPVRRPGFLSALPHVLRRRRV